METKALTELVKGMYGRIQVFSNLLDSQEGGILARRLAIEEKGTPRYTWDRDRVGHLYEWWISPPVVRWQRRAITSMIRATYKA
jgi:hypothetical protein